MGRIRRHVHDAADEVALVIENAQIAGDNGAGVAFGHWQRENHVRHGVGQRREAVMPIRARWAAIADARDFVRRRTLKRRHHGRPRLPANIRASRRVWRKKVYGGLCNKRRERKCNRQRRAALQFNPPHLHWLSGIFCLHGLKISGVFITLMLANHCLTAGGKSHG
jgi:hypothetical protein